MRTAAEKFKEDLEKRILWWRTEFDLDHFTASGVLMDVLIDLLFSKGEDEDDEDEDEHEDEDE